MDQELSDQVLRLLREKRRETRLTLKKIDLAIEALEGEPSKNGRPEPTPTLFDEQPDRFKSMSNIAVAEDVLKEIGKPTHIDDLIDAMLKAGFQYDGNRTKLKRSLVGSLDRRVRDEDGKMYKPAPATYALAEWQENDTDTGEEDAGEASD